MEKVKLDFITARLKAINRISYILDTKESTEWDFTSICQIFVDTIGYNSCWIALTNDRGEVRDFSRFHSAGFLSEEGEKARAVHFNDFIRDVLVFKSDHVLNMDPILDYIDPSVVKNSPRYNSVTMKLIYNNMIYGVLSVTFSGTYDFLKEEVLIITEVVKTISFFLYDIDSRNKIHDLFLTMFETTGTGVTLIEEDTTISYANREFELLSGFSKEEIEGKKSFAEFVMDEDRDRMVNYHRTRRVDPDRAPRNYEFSFKDRYGNKKNIYMTIDLVPRTKVSIASYMNVTEKKRLESEVLKISEQERQDIGNDLHDGLGPHLVGIRFIVKLMREKIARGEVPDIEQVDEVDSLITMAIDHTRTITKGLKPVDIQSDGLIYALEELTADVGRRFGIVCSLEYNVPISIDNNIAATHLYYIVREAINNAVKHGAPGTIAVILNKKGDSLTVEIVDDGKGMPDLIDNNAGMGINIMKYRANIINGSIEFLTVKNGGTRIICTLKI